MRIPNAAHEAHAAVIEEIAPDFELLDAWALPVEGRSDEFVALVDRISAFDPAAAGSTVTRALFWVRLRLGALFGWDDPTKQRSIPGAAETSLAARVPDELRGTAKAIDGAITTVAGGFVPLYQTDNEWAAEIANDTVHGVLHLVWADQGGGRYRAQMGVYVKARGLLGELYLKAIGPFRHLIVYPSLMRHIGRAWESRRSTVDTDEREARES